MKYKTNTSHSKPVIYGLAGILVLLIATAGITLYPHLKSVSSPKVAVNNGTATANPNVPGGTNQPSGSTGGNADSKNGSGATGATSLSPNVQPAAPSGQFVSNHMARLSGSVLYSTETSTCITTPGAYCQISFQMGGTVKVLPKIQTDASGSAVWNSWTLSQIGLTAGTWNISAVASNGSLTATAKDTIQLTVSQ